MAKVDLGLVEWMRDENISLLARSQQLESAIEALGMFCQDCGETDPEDGFYPVRMFSNDSLSWFLCHSCEKKRRGETK